MKHYKLVIFDMDGTLADTSLGIYNCHKHALVKMGRDEPTTQELSGIIGGPLLESYLNRFEFDEESAAKAVQIYRARYKEKGIYEAQLYEGIRELLLYLKERGYKIGVATLKAELFAIKLLEEMKIIQYFDVIKGVDDKDTLTKAELLRLCMLEMGVKNEESVLIGDSKFDAIGAENINMDFIGVTYGFGFKSLQDIEQYKHVGSVNRCEDIRKIL